MARDAVADLHLARGEMRGGPALLPEAFADGGEGRLPLKLGARAERARALGEDRR
jgi:hypothetical protein